jgi:hypothetical protein
MMERNKIMYDEASANEGGQLRGIIGVESAHSEGSVPGCSKPRLRFLIQLIVCFSDFSLWFSLPLSVWLSSGWIGLIFHWRAITAMACPVKEISHWYKRSLERSVALCLRPTSSLVNNNAD